MVKSILTAASIQGRRGRFTGPAPDTYVVWRDDHTTDGPDGLPAALIRHDVTLELYEARPDDAAEADLEAAIVAEGLHYSKQDRYWLQTEQMYLVVYEFSYNEKRRT